MTENAQPTTTPAKRRVPFWAQILVWVGLLGLLAVLALALKRSQQGIVSVGDAVKDFTLTTFSDEAHPDGEQITLSGLRGKVVAINFWASWCKPCEQEAPDLEAAWRFYQHGGEVAFLGVDYVDTEPEARAYLAKFDITYPNGPDLGTRISQAFNRQMGVPETYFIDRQGKLRYIQIGPFQSVAEIQAIIDPLLAEK
jgi:cytochrome c biogenesis protein CcmG/thiol:disulfide interchange protein DsbE